MLIKTNKISFALCLIATFFLSNKAHAFGKRPTVTPPSTIIEPEIIRARWEFSQRDGAEWSKFVYNNITTQAPSFLSRTPTDISNFCRNYPNLSTGDKKNFWVYLMSAMSEFESGHNPENYYVEAFSDVKGNSVVSRGLLQISIESANAYGCGFNKVSELHDPYKNLSCSLKILNRWISNDGRIAGKSGSSWQGGARYWSVLRYTNAPLAKIQAWTQALDICIPR